MGGRSAQASAVAGPGVASTQQAASGPGAQVAGVSQVGQKVDACVRGPADSAACQTLTTERERGGCRGTRLCALIGGWRGWGGGRVLGDKGPECSCLGQSCDATSPVPILLALALSPCPPCSL